MGGDNARQPLKCVQGQVRLGGPECVDHNAVQGLNGKKVPDQENIIGGSDAVAESMLFQKNRQLLLASTGIIQGDDPVEIGQEAANAHVRFPLSGADLSGSRR